MQTTVGPAAISVPSPLFWDGRVLPYSWARPLAFRTMDSLRLRFGLSIRDPLFSSRLMFVVLPHASTVPCGELGRSHASTVPCGNWVALMHRLFRAGVAFVMHRSFHAERSEQDVDFGGTRREIEGISRHLQRRAGAKLRAHGFTLTRSDTPRTNAESALVSGEERRASWGRASGPNESRASPPAFSDR
jgi:hypothetical protein